MRCCFIILLCFLYTVNGAAQRAADSAFQQALKQYGPRPGHNTPTSDDLQHLKDAMSARQQASINPVKDTAVASPASAGDCTPIAAAPVNTTFTGIDYAHNDMFKKCLVTASFSTATGDTSSDAQEQSHAGSGLTANGSLKFTAFISDIMGRNTLVAGQMPAP